MLVTHCRHSVLTVDVKPLLAPVLPFAPGQPSVRQFMADALPRDQTIMAGAFQLYQQLMAIVTHLGKPARRPATRLAAKIPVMVWRSRKPCLLQTPAPRHRAGSSTTQPEAFEHGNALAARTEWLPAPIIALPTQYGQPHAGNPRPMDGNRRGNTLQR